MAGWENWVNPMDSFLRIESRNPAREDDSPGGRGKVEKAKALR
jgi:hypothetical protein